MTNESLINWFVAHEPRRGTRITQIEQIKEDFLFICVDQLDPPNLRNQRSYPTA